MEKDKMNKNENKEYIEHEIIDRLYCMEELDFNKDTVTQDYIEAVIKAGKEAKELIEKQQKEIERQAKEIERQDRNIHKLNLDKIQQQKEIEELKEKISKAIGHIEACKTTLGNYILTPDEIECLLNILREKGENNE